MKNTLDGMNSRLDMTEVMITKLEGNQIHFSKIYSPKMKTTSAGCVMTSSRVMYKQCGGSREDKKKHLKNDGLKLSTLKKLKPTFPSSMKPKQKKHLEKNAKEHIIKLLKTNDF